MFCAKCGKEIQNNAAFCRYCGAKVRHPKAMQPMQTPPPKASAPQANPGTPAQSKDMQPNTYAAQPDHRAQAPKQSAPKPPVKTKSHRSIIIISIAAVVVVAGLVAGGVILARDRQGREEELLTAQEQLAEAQQDAAEAQEQAEQAQQQADQAQKEAEAAQKAKEQAETAQQQAEAARQQAEQASKQSVSAVRSQAESELSQVETQSAQLESLLNNATDQASLNRYSQQLFTLWDDEINVLWSHLQNSMSESAFDALTDEQVDWIVAKEAAIDAAGSQFKGGSAEPMARNTEGYKWTRDRVYYLMDYLP